MQFIKNNITVLLFSISVLFYFHSCSLNRDAVKIAKHTEIQLDSFKLELSRLELVIERDGLEVSKRIIYDENTIVRSKNRPDDIIIKYQSDIDKLNKILK